MGLSSPRNLRESCSHVATTRLTCSSLTARASSSCFPRSTSCSLAHTASASSHAQNALSVSASVIDSSCPRKRSASSPSHSRLPSRSARTRAATSSTIRTRTAESASARWIGTTASLRDVCSSCARPASSLSSSLAWRSSIHFHTTWKYALESGWSSRSSCRSWNQTGHGAASALSCCSRSSVTRKPGRSSSASIHATREPDGEAIALIACSCFCGWWPSSRVSRSGVRCGVVSAALEQTELSKQRMSASARVRSGALEHSHRSERSHRSARLLQSAASAVSAPCCSSARHTSARFRRAALLSRTVASTLRMHDVSELSVPTFLCTTT